MSGQPPAPHRMARIQRLICLVVLVVILLAGLLPFRGPRNDVSWLPHQNGVRLSTRSTILSSANLSAVDSGSRDSCSLEIWLQPGFSRDSNTILAFSTPENTLQLTLHQYHAAVILQTGVPGTRRTAWTIGTDGAFHSGVPTFVTISSGPGQTVVYINGALARTSPWRIADDCHGQLVLGTSPVRDESWHGQLRGLALYGRELTPDQVRRHYESWTVKGSPDPSDEERAVALYLFSDHAGRVVHNAIPGGIDLEIPTRYSLVHQTFLQPFWQEFRPRWSYVKNLLINIIGFMPLGITFYAYWSAARPMRQAALLTTVFGFAVSLTIEVLQSKIPTRDSGTTDLITNTLGTFLGVQLHRWGAVRALLSRIYSARIS
jgi:VanZ family protein